MAEVGRGNIVSELQLLSQQRLVELVSEPDEVVLGLR
jgi:hypothetical protein